MAIVQNPLIGRARKKAGGMIFQTVYNKNIMRAAPFVYRDKKSVPQISNRYLFDNAFNWTRHLKPHFSALGWDQMPLSTNRSMFHSIFSMLRAGLSFVDEVWDFDPAQLRWGLGTLPFTTYHTFLQQDGAEGKISWNPAQVRPGGSTSDIVMIVMLAVDAKYAWFVDSEVPVSAGEFVFNFPYHPEHIDFYANFLLITRNVAKTQFSVNAIRLTPKKYLIEYY